MAQKNSKLQQIVAELPQGGLANIGHGNGQANRSKETIWFSPHCLSDSQGSLF